MPEAVIGGARAASEALSSKASPPNTIVLASEDEEDPADVKQPEPKKDVETAEEKGAPDTDDAKGTEAQDAETDAEGDGQEGHTEKFIVAGVDVSSYAAEYAKDGHLSGATYKALEDAGFPRDMVDAYIRGLQGTVDEAEELAQKEVDAILEEVGGVERYEKVMAWAADKLSDEERDAYDKAVSGKDPTVARLVVQGLMSRYEREHGSEPTLVMGTKAPAPEALGGYKDRSSMIKAMNDPRYGTDPDYTREVERKVIASGLMRGRGR